MARGKLTPAELLALHNNPYVIDANETRIIYSNEFKFHFMQEYNKGYRSAGRYLPFRHLLPAVPQKFLLLLQ